MASVFTTEITSGSIPSDNPIHQRLLKAYVWAADLVSGHTLEVGCGEGRGLDLLLPRVTALTAIDKLTNVIGELRKRYPSITFIYVFLPPLRNLAVNSFDCVLSFQVIE
ncbi:MAG TPA: SAM-dependent methyltransferase, partial [Cytophagales bacterium]|nr:SAM-dependent methyltransferase [Cytophagales bacterium]